VIGFGRPVWSHAMAWSVMAVIVPVVVAVIMVVPVVEPVGMRPELSLSRLPESVLDRLGPPDPRHSGSVAFLIELLRQFLAQPDIDLHRVRLLPLGYTMGNTPPDAAVASKPVSQVQIRGMVSVCRNAIFCRWRRPVFYLDNVGGTPSQDQADRAILPPVWANGLI
jgi:hypothetical protein